MSAHTPGPWRVNTYAVVADHPVPGVYGSDDVRHYGGHLIAESVAPQNRALIAAAPDLLAALEALLGAEEDGSEIPAIALAHKAIARAKGEPA